MFRVGQEVECIDAGPMFGLPAPTELKRGRIYIIRGFTTHPFYQHEGPILEGIKRVWKGVDCPFYVGRFRPIVSRKTDIAIFTAMLNPSLEDLRAIVRENANA